MNLLFLVWLADASSSVSFAIGALGYVGMFGAVLLGLHLHDKNKSLWAPVMAGIGCLALMLLAAAMPSKQGVYQLMAAYGAVETVQYLQQSDDAKRIAGKSIQAIEKMLDDALKEDKK